MARHRRTEGHFGRVVVADLADHDHLGVVPQERAQVVRERVAQRLVDLGLAELVVDVTSIGSSAVTTRISGRYSVLSAACIVVLLPDPVGPVISTMPEGR